MEEKETIVKEIVGDVILAAISIYVLNMFLTDVLPRIFSLGVVVFEKLN